MRKAKTNEGRKCPKCGDTTKQNNNGHNRSGTQRCLCPECGCSYTLGAKRRAYSEEIRQIAIKEYMMGISARGVGKIHGMSGNNVLFWIKKTGRIVDKSKN